MPSPFGRPVDDDRLQRDVAGPPTAEAEPISDGLRRFLRVRTAYFDHAVLHALDEGVRQVIAVGAGYDGRSLRYERPGVRWFELDHPATQADKRGRLDRLGIDASSVVFVAADFTTDDLAGALHGAGLDAAVPALFTCEGVTGYFHRDVLDRVFAALASSAAPGSRLVTTIALEPTTERERAVRKKLATRVAELGEPLHGSVPRDQLDSLFGAANWEVEQAVDPRGVPILDGGRSPAFVTAQRVR